MLKDCKRLQERWAAWRRERRKLPAAWGEFLSRVDWHWFVTVTFRREAVPDKALSQIVEYLALLDKGSSGPIGWLIAEEFGPFGGRFHCHLLVTGVKGEERKFWWKEAFRRFGRTRIEPFDPRRAAAFYAAKYAAKSLGNLELGGTVNGIDLTLRSTPSAPCGGQDVALSAEVPKQFYRLGLKRQAPAWPAKTPDRNAAKQYRLGLKGRMGGHRNTEES